MIERIIDLSEEPARLSVDLGRLVIQRKAQDDMAIPLEEIAVLVVAHRQVIYSHAVLAGLARAGGAFIPCDERRMPVGLMLPIEQHHLQAERFAIQAQAPLPRRKRAWQQVVTAKVRAQGNLLHELHNNDRGLLSMAQRVRSGDSENIEGQASRRYWPALFADSSFRRDREAEDQNRLLNYGYAVLRAIVARAVCAAGLHPSLGIHHHNRYDAFCLADDLMEPFRPIVDRAVARYIWEHGAEAPLDRQAKSALLAALTHKRFPVDAEERTLFDVAARTASSLVKVFAGEQEKLALPDRV